MDPGQPLELPSLWAPPPLLQEWGWPCLETQGYASTSTSTSSSSPASSPDSCSLSPACLGAAAATAATAPLWLGPQGTEGPPRLGPGARKGPRGRLGSGQRHSASQREKLRMRQLAKALRSLRHFLPPSVAPAGQALTKIETLRLAIRYIAHLSQLLGLSEAALLAHRRGAALACPCQRGPAPQPQSPPPAQERQELPGPESWPWPPSGLQPPSFLETSSTDRGGAPCCRPGSSPGASGSPATEAASWSSALFCPEEGNPAAAPAGSGGGLGAAEPLLLPAELADLGLSPQSLPGELVSFLEGFLPLASQD